MKGRLNMFFIIYKNPQDKDYEDFLICDSKQEIQDIIDNFKYPADYRVFNATENFEFKKENHNVSYKAVF